MLTAVVLELTAVKAPRLPASHGAMAYAAALDLILRQDASLARDLHDQEGPKPLKVGALQGEMVLAGRERVLEVGESCFWRLAALEARTASLLAGLSSGGGVRIGEGVFEISAVHRTSSEHPAAGQSSYEELTQAYCGTARLPATVTLEFLTPTTFRAGTMEQPFPIPSLVFQSLGRQWGRWSNLALPVEEEALKNGISLGNWQGETRRVELGGRRTVGFVGRYTYRLPKAMPEAVRAACILGKYAFYAGVGWQTAHGMGQVRCL